MFDYVKSEMVLIISKVILDSSIPNGNGGDLWDFIFSWAVIIRSSLAHVSWAG